MINFFRKIIILTVLFFASISVSAFENIQDLISVTQPSVVHIVSNTKGIISIPNITFDYENNTIGTTTKSFSTTTVDSSVQGTGFIISSDGVVVTHSGVLVGDLNTVYRSEAKKYLQNINTQNQKYDNAYKNIFNYLKENSIQNIEQDIKIIKPGNSYNAKIFYTNYTFENDDGVGLLKIDIDNLPSIPLSDSEINTGQEVYSISHPLIERMVSEPIFSQGIVNAIKNNQYQTSIYLSEGSKGSPIFDEYGKVVGIMNSLGFAIPSSYIKEALATTSLTIKPGLYVEYYKAGLILLENNRCKSALVEFDKAQKINPDFSVTEYLKPKVDKCNSIILAGESRDTFLDEIIYLFKNNTSNIYIWSTLLILFLLLIIFYKYFLNRFRKDEENMKFILKEKSLYNEDIKNKTTDKTIDKAIDKAKNFIEIEPFEDFMEFNPVVPSISSTKIVPIEKVEVTPRPESPHAPITPPKAIQPDGPVVVITPFKTLNKPINSLSSNSSEIKRDIKTDLPSMKKDEGVI